MFTTGETVDLAEWIIDDTCLVLVAFPCEVNFCFQIDKKVSEKSQFLVCLSSARHSEKKIQNCDSK